MFAIEITEWGAPDVLHAADVCEPEPAEGEVVVDVEAVEVLFLDTQIRAGWGRDFFAMRPPFVPGTGVAGRVGDRRVVARTGDFGAYAERVAVPAAEAIDVPPGLDPVVATAALHDGVLALQRLSLTPPGPGDVVLVTAAAGSLGHWLVPLAAGTGATVVGAAGGPEKAAVVRGLGADVALDYRADGWLDGAGTFDVVFDGAGGAVGRAALAQTRDGGAFHAYGAASGDFGAAEAERGIRVLGVEQQIVDADWRRWVREGLAAIAAGRVRPHVGQRVPLARAADAHRAMEARQVVGKTVLIV